MPAKTVADAFTQFTSKITPTTAQRETMSDRRARADEVLRAAFKGSNMPLIRTKLIGSAGRNTVVRPLSDVDVFAVFNDDQVWNTYRGDSSKLLYRVRDALNAKYNIKVGSRKQAVRLFFNSDPQVEIVPAFTVTTGGYCIPSGQANFFGGYKWQMTDPYVHEQFIDKRNTELDGRLRPLIRLLKRWNAVTGKHFSSFHLELIVQASFSTIGTSVPMNTHQFFEWAPNHLNVSDPAGHSGNLMDGIDFFKTITMRNALKTAYDRTAKALESAENGKQAEAIRLWRITFGDEFPVYG
jgi:hypothetical protein